MTTSVGWMSILRWVVRCRLKQLRSSCIQMIYWQLWLLHPHMTTQSLFWVLRMAGSNERSLKPWPQPLNTVTRRLTSLQSTRTCFWTQIETSCTQWPTDVLRWWKYRVARWKRRAATVWELVIHSVAGVHWRISVLFGQTVLKPLRIRSTGCLTKVENVRRSPTSIRRRSKELQLAHWPYRSITCRMLKAIFSVHSLNSPKHW